MPAACPVGHHYTPENTYVREDGRRECRACGRERKTYSLDAFESLDKVTLLPLYPAAESAAREQVDQLLATLTPLQRDVISMWMHNVPAAEVARILGRHPETLRYHRDRAFKRLKEAVAA